MKSQRHNTINMENLQLSNGLGRETVTIPCIVALLYWLKNSIKPRENKANSAIWFFRKSRVSSKRDERKRKRERDSKIERE